MHFFVRRSVMLLVLSLLVVSACTKKREAEFVQGQGINLDSMSAFQNRTFVLNTHEEIGKADVSAAADVKIGEDVAGLNQLNIVNYDTSASLLGTVPLRGRPNFQYEIRYELTQNFLKVLKVGNKKDMPYQELTYATDLGNDQVAIPLVGYNIQGYFRLEKVKSNGEDTSTVTEIPEPDMNKASHVKVDFNSRTIYEAVKKIDVFPSGLFEGEWYYSETITAASEGMVDNIGSGASVDFKLQEATQIKFIKANNTLRAVNIGIDERINREDEVQLVPVIEIPVKFVDYRSARKGNDTDLKEEKYDERAPKDRSMMEVDFQNARSQGIGIANGQRTDLKLVDLEVAKDYVSFTHFDPANSIRVKYSFYKAQNPTYVSRKYFRADQKTFGAFFNMKPIASQYEIHHTTELDALRLMNRFDPNKNIVFNFSATSPKNYRDVGRKAIAEWNDAFIKAGVKARVLLDETKDVQVGDLRYNVINIIDSISGGGLYGLGPSLSNLQTGEIISATANVWVQPIRASLVDSLRIYLMEKLGIISVETARKNAVNEVVNWMKASSSAETGMMTSGRISSHMNSRTTQFMIDSLKKSRDMSVAANEFKAKNQTKLERELLAELDKLNKAAKNSEKEVKKLGNYHIRTASVCDHGASGGNTAEAVETLCPEVADYLKDLQSAYKASGALTLPNEVQVLETCALKIVPERLLAILLHEMGHNLSLRHNFRGSTDGDNFFTAAETGTKTQVVTSSVMDYMTDDETRLVKAGKYDIAAIAFLYGDRVETTTGEWKQVDPKKSIADNMREMNAKMRPYHFCTDEDAYYGLDAICSTWDSGTDPEKIANGIINSYYSFREIAGRRLDRFYGYDSARIGLYTLFRVAFPLQRIYQEYRLLLEEKVGLTNGYLEQLDEAKYNQLMADITKDKNSTLAAYKRASDNIFMFLSTMAFGHNAYCIGKAAGKAPVVLELSRLRQQAYTESKARVESCQDPIVKIMLGTEKVEQVGTEIKDSHFLLSEENRTEHYDVVGNELEKVIAMLILSERMDVGSFFRTSGSTLAPNFLDEPENRSYILSRIMDRAVNGVTINKDVKAVPRFEMESDILTSQMVNSVSGLMLPGKFDYNQVNMTPFRVRLERDVQYAIQAIQSGGAVIPYSSYYLIAEAENEVSVMFMKRMNTISRLAAVPTTEGDFKTLQTAISKLPGREEIKDMTVEDYFKAFNEFMKALQTTKTISDFIRYLGQDPNNPSRLNVLLDLTDELDYQMRKLAAQGDDAKVEAYKKTKVVDAIKALPKDITKNLPADLGNPLGKENLAGLEEPYKVYTPEAAKRYAYYTANKSDFQAQKDMLFRFLDAFSGL